VGLVALDQLVLKHKRLKFGLGHPPGDIGNFSQQRLGARLWWADA
jgi:hypothetical protein